MTNHPTSPTATDSLIVAITGATGAIYGVRLLERLREFGIATHLVISPWGRRTLELETDYTVAQVEALATTVQNFRDLGATISSGSVQNRGMIIAPCSVKTLASISQGLADNLVSRAADVVLKERRKLLLLVRETPLNEIHIENMLRLSRMGVVIMPPVPAFYNLPESLDDVVTYTVARALDQFGIVSGGVRRWDGTLRRDDDLGDVGDDYEIGPSGSGQDYDDGEIGR